jgi:hypothetical protein
LKGRGKRFAAPIYIRRERVIQTPSNLRVEENKNNKKGTKKKMKSPSKRKPLGQNQPARLQLLA